ncbi:MAG: hypothetical protein FWF59_04600 [Turicibacter sp.]|nr:hypothetical protein [Turicibacter sp.]
MNFTEISSWYNGYFKESGAPIYNPTSVSEALLGGVIFNYWNQTETYEALAEYIALDFDGLRQRIVQMLSGESIEIKIDRFRNDMSKENFKSADDILTLLVHLGYLSYHIEDKTVPYHWHSTRPDNFTP